MKFSFNRLAHMMPAGVSRKIGRVSLVGQKHSPTVLLVAGVVGVVATVVIASRATLKLDDVLQETNDNIEKAQIALDSQDVNFTETEYKAELIKIRSAGVMQVARLYTPAIAVGCVAVACLTGSHVVLTRRNFALTAAYAALEKGYEQYRQRLIDEFGPDKDFDYRYGVEDREVTEKTAEGETKVAKVKYLKPEGRGSQYSRFFDEVNSTSWKKDQDMNLMFIRVQQNWANDLLRHRGHLFLNEVYDMLGMERTKAGAVVGWVWNGNGDNKVDFGVFSEDNIYMGQRFVNGTAMGVLLDFNVDGVIYDKI